MRVGTGVMAYRKARPARLGLAMMAGAASLCGAAHAAETAADAEAAPTVSGVEVKGDARPLDHATGLRSCSPPSRTRPRRSRRHRRAAEGPGDQQPGRRAAQRARHHHRHRRGRHAVGRPVQDPRLRRQGRRLCRRPARLRRPTPATASTTRRCRSSRARPAPCSAAAPPAGRSTPSPSSPGSTTSPASTAMSATGDYYRALADINHQIGDTSAVRLNLMGNSTGVVDRDHDLFRPLGRGGRPRASASGPTPPLVVSYLHQHDHQRPDYGVIVVQPPGSIIALPATEYGVGVERSSFLGYRNDIDRVGRRHADRALQPRGQRQGRAHPRHPLRRSIALLPVLDAGPVHGGLHRRPVRRQSGDRGQSAATAAQGPYDMDAWGLQNISTARIDYDLGRLQEPADRRRRPVAAGQQQDDLRLHPAGRVHDAAGDPAAAGQSEPEFPGGLSVFRAVPGQNITCPATTANCTTVVNGATVFTNTLGTATEQEQRRPPPTPASSSPTASGSPTACR